MNRVVWRVAVLLGTAWVMVATSRPPCSGKLPETVTFQVAGTCGPAGVVVISSDATCQLTVDGGASVLLPDLGTQTESGPLATSTIFLGGAVRDLDGGRIPLPDGGTRPAPSDEYPGGCVGGCPFIGTERRCSGAFDGGVLELECFTEADESCSVRLTPP